MAYMLLMMEPTGQRKTRSPDEGREVYDRMLRWGAELKSRGLLMAAESLQPLDSATRVQVRGGKPQFVDGPFAEAKEMLGGFFLVDCATREQALELATQCPAAEWLTVEVRGLGPCFEH